MSIRRAPLLLFSLLLVIFTVNGASEHWNDEKTIQKRLYRQLYLSLYDSMKHSKSHDLILRRTGLTLQYTKFEVPDIYKDVQVVRIPTAQYKAGGINNATAETILRAVLPPWVVQAMFDISDNIPNMTHWIANPEDGNVVQFSATYSTVVNKMLDHIRNQNFLRLKNVYSYLKEPLHDKGRNDSTKGNNTARLILYHRYKREYYQTKLLIETEINSNRKDMSRKHFKWWYKMNHPKLLQQVQECLNKWYNYGQKTQVEDWIAQTHEFNEVHNIEAAKRLLRAYKQPAWDQYTASVNWDSDDKQDDTFIYRVRFQPLDWFEYLKLKFSESKDQIKHRIKENKKLIKKLKGMKEKAVERTTSPDYLKTYREMKKRYIVQKTKLMKSVMARKYNTQMCRYTTRKKYCQAVTKLRPIINKLQSRHAAIHWEYQKFKTPLPKYGGHIIKTIDKEINSSMNESLALNKLLKINSSWIPQYNVSYPTESSLNFIKFHFNPMKYQHKIKRFNDFKLPKRLKEGRLWYLNRDKGNNRKVNLTISKYLQTVEGYLNSIARDITVNATLLKVNIERKWFNQTLFRTLMKFSQAEFLVSPGPQSNPSKFRKLVSSNRYLLPAFPSSLLIATDVQIMLPNTIPSNILKDLLTLSYEPRVSGGYGPFTFGYMYGNKSDKIRKQFKLRIDKYNTNIIISIPGSQLIGYLCHVVNKFPS